MVVFNQQDQHITILEVLLWKCRLSLLWNGKNASEQKRPAPMNWWNRDDKGDGYILRISTYPPIYESRIEDMGSDI